MFRTVPLSIIRSFLLYTQQWYMSYRFSDSLWAGSGRNWVPSRSCSQAVWHIPLLCVQWKKTPDDRQRNCPKHVEFYSKNKFERLVHLVGFIKRTHIVCLYVLLFFHFFCPYLLKYSLSATLPLCIFFISWMWQAKAQDILSRFFLS